VPITLQQQYSLVCREIEYEVIPAALHNGIGILPWSPLGAGFLSGKYTRDVEPGSGTRYGKDSAMARHRKREVYKTDRSWATVEMVQRIAGELGATPSQVALSWVTNRPAVTSSIIGARTMEQLEDVLGSAELDLDAGTLSRLDHVSAPTPDDYPYGRFGVLQRDRYVDSSDQALREL
ncbi:MAG: aldo/keto reductase, partial [Microvirga sp.]